MAGLTQRENILKVFHGEIPEWVPVSRDASQLCFGPSFMLDWNRRDDAKKGDHAFDLFGVEYEISDPRIGPMPAPNVFKITDITKWGDQFPVKNFPDLHAVDWAAQAQKDTADWDRKNKYTRVGIGGSGSGTTYMWMATLLGHENAMIAMLTEPEAWDELLDELTKFQEEQIRLIANHFKPDSIVISDDCAFNKTMFMSPETYRDRIKPFHRRLVKAILDNGCTPEIHCCGKADAIADDFAEIGIRCWNPAQVFNDLEGVKARNGNSLILEGAWDSNGAAGIKGADEETVRAAVRSAIDRCAPGGGYIFSISGMTAVYDVGEEHFGWIFDEAVRYGAGFYR